ncbi:MAG: formate--tetrahydrofolate ligase [bacterium]|nr:formate--tetrahydrofolate ligase [bacterium]
MSKEADIKIAQSTPMLPITEIARAAGIADEYLEPFGRFKAKVDLGIFHNLKKPDGKLILVTAINPTPSGEGKTTVTIGLADALHKLGNNVMAALREPSLGPVFGMKGGATGGGKAQLLPMEDINLHFNGDFHAISTANNLLAAMLDNHVYQSNSLNIDVRRITWRRALDVNDRQLRNVVSGLGGRVNGVPQEAGFDITAASEIMAIMGLTENLADLKERLGRIVVGYTRDEQPITAHDLHAEGAMTALLKDAIKPNLVQTLEHTPVLVHCGPFGNIAHGCNSIIATRLALKLADYAVTEAGFGADLGAEKFLDIKCRLAKLHPSAAVVVATVRALKYNGGLAKNDLEHEDLPALERGLPNLLQHVENLTKVFHLPVVVAINRFISDTEAELKLIADKCAELGVKAILTDVWGQGGQGGQELAQEVIKLCHQPNDFTFAYDLHDTIENKLRTIVQNIYHGDDVEILPAAKKQADALTKLGFGDLPICVAKTQYSFTDDPKLLGAPRDFKVTVRNLKVSAGAGFIVALTGEINTMPGLPKVPSAEQIDVNEEGKITF